MNPIERLLEQIDEFVRTSGTWKDKKQLLLDNATDEQKTSLSELISWFDEEFEEGLDKEELS